MVDKNGDMFDTLCFFCYLSFNVYIILPVSISGPRPRNFRVSISIQIGNVIELQNMEGTVMFAIDINQRLINYQSNMNFLHNNYLSLSTQALQTKGNKQDS